MEPMDTVSGVTVISPNYKDQLRSYGLTDLEWSYADVQ